MSIPLERLKLARFQPRIQSAWARTEGQGDIREIAPRRPASLDAPVIAAPMSGDNLESISQDWMQRQANLITGGQDQILLKEMNQKMNSAFRQMSGSGDAEPGEEASRSPASLSRESADEASMVPPIKFTALNRFEVGLPSDANLSCAVQGSSMQFDLSRTVGERVNVNLRHDTSTNSNTVRLHYTW